MSTMPDFVSAILTFTTRSTLTSTTNVHGGMPTEFVREENGEYVEIVGNKGEYDGLDMQKYEESLWMT